MNALAGITHRGSKPVTNPTQHTPVRLQDRIILEKHTPDGQVQRVIQEGNVLCSFGLDNLAQQVAEEAISHVWIEGMGIGTDTDTPASTVDSLAASTKFLSGASCVISDLGARTVEARATFSDGDGYSIKEVGLFYSNVATASCIAYSSLNVTDQVIKGTADTVNVSYQVIFVTA